MISCRRLTKASFFMATTISIKSLLEAGVHFGHQTRRWNPKMKPYIWGSRNSTHIIDLKKTLYAVDDAYTFLSHVAARGAQILFVGTKKQAQEPLKNAAERVNMPYVNYRWMGGMLTNFKTIKTRVERMEEIEAMKASSLFDSYNKKEQAGMNKELEKLQAALGGIRDMHTLPAAIFVVDTNHEINAVREARRLNIPIVGLIDTNCNPDEVDYGIPANDDAIRSVRLFCDVVADAIAAGASAPVTEREMTKQKEPAEKKKNAPKKAAKAPKKDTKKKAEAEKPAKEEASAADVEVEAPAEDPKVEAPTEDAKVEAPVEDTKAE